MVSNIYHLQVTEKKESEDLSFLFISYFKSHVKYSNYQTSGPTRDANNQNVITLFGETNQVYIS